MKTLSHIPQQADIPDKFIGCHDPKIKSLGRFYMTHEIDHENDNVGWIFRHQSDKSVGLNGWHERRDSLVNQAIKYRFTVLSFSSQAELDAWLKEGK